MGRRQLAWFEKQLAGDAVTNTTTAAGRNWYTTTWTINSPSDYVNFVFNRDKNTQTVDVNGVARTSYFEIQPESDSMGHYLVSDITDEITNGIATVSIGDGAADNRPTRVTAFDGTTVRTFGTHVTVQKATEGMPSGFYIVNGKKVAVR